MNIPKTPANTGKMPPKKGANGQSSLLSFFQKGPNTQRSRPSQVRAALDTPPTTEERAESSTSRPSPSSAPNSSPTATRQTAAPTRTSPRRNPVKTGQASRTPVSREPTPPSSDPIVAEEDDDDEPVITGRRGSAKRPATYAESASEEDEDDADVDSFKPKTKRSHKSSAGPKSKKRRVQDDEDDFIVSDHDISEGEMNTFFDDDEGSDEDNAVRKSTKKKPAVPKDSPPAGSSSISSFKRGAVQPQGSSISPRPAPVPSRSRPSTSNSHLTKAERKVQSDKDKKAANEAAFSFLLDIKDRDGNRPGHPDYDPRTLHVPKSAWKDFTPFEKQFWEVKQNHWDTVLFFQKGKFYELYEEDALIGHREFDLKLTDRVKMKMVGVPESSFELFAAKFLALGYKVGRVDQVETAVAKGMRVGEKSRGGGSEIVRRELRHVLTGGTIVDSGALPDDLSSYCVSIKESIAEDGSQEPSFGVCTLDASTAEFNLTGFQDDISRTRLETLLRSLRLKELIHEKGGLSQQSLRVIRNSVPSSCQITMLKPGSEFLDSDTTLRKLNLLFNPDHAGSSADTDEVEAVDPAVLPEAIASMIDKPLALSSLGGMLWYLTQLNLDRDLCSSRNFNIFDPIKQNKCLVLDAQSLLHLNVLNNELGTDEGTLHQLLNRCVTPFGKRLFKIWLVAPLADPTDITARQDAVDDLITSVDFTQAFDKFGKKLPDIERIIPRIYAGKCKPSDFTKVLNSLLKFESAIASLVGIAEEFQSGIIAQQLRAIPNVTAKVEQLKGMFDESEDGGWTPRSGVREDFDEAEEALTAIEGQLESELRKCKKDLGLSSKEISWKHIGTKDIYQIAIPKKTKVPNNWSILSQTKTEDRYYSPTVKDLVQQLKEGRETRLAALKRFHVQLFEAFANDGPVFLAAVKAVAEIDCLLSLAKASFAMGEPACRPEFVECDTALVDFSELRHPCIGTTGSTATDFVPNNVALGGEHNEVIILTGGNMAGKSTTARTTATAVILAQLGCRVPAASARISPVDRIASRMGANDQIFRNNSTFMVEMLEASRIINECTPRSLVIMDELGRGTSTFDGQAIAFAVLHHLVGRTRCLSFFLTHYTNLAYDFDEYPRVSNKHMEVLVDDDKLDVTFTYNLIPGIAESSYGTQVAALAGVPHEACKRAMDVSRQFMLNAKELQAERSQSRIPVASLADFAHLVKLGTAAENGDMNDAAAEQAAAQFDVINAQSISAALEAAKRAVPSADAMDVDDLPREESTAGEQITIEGPDPVSARSLARGSVRSYGRSNRVRIDPGDNDFIARHPRSSPVPRRTTLPPLRSQSSPSRPGNTDTDMRSSSPVPMRSRSTNSSAAPRAKEQMILDFGQKIRVTCGECDMSYDRSAPDDVALHKRHHERVVKGIEWGPRLVRLADQVAGSVALPKSLAKTLDQGQVSPATTDSIPGPDGLPLDSSRVTILSYDLGTADKAKGPVSRKATEVLQSIDEALGAATLPDDVRKTAKLFVAIRAGRVLGAALVGRVRPGTARRIVPPPSDGTAPADVRAYDADDAVFVSGVLSEAQTPPIGVHRIHVLPALRRAGLGSALLDAVLGHTLYSLDEPALIRMYGARAACVAFSQPTAAGRRLLERWAAAGIRNGKEDAQEYVPLCIFEE